jgi:hypothetical protein
MGAYHGQKIGDDRSFGRQVDMAMFSDWKKPENDKMSGLI